jgi:phosphoesterase RecJ-like protein
MQLSEDGEIAWCIVTPEMESETGADDDDVRATINHLIFIRGVRVALLFKQRGENRVKISLRARAGFDVAEFARSLDPGGGGHSRAAGCSQEGSLEQVAEVALDALQKALATS